MNDRDEFERHFNNVERMVKYGFKTIFVIWVTSAFIGLCALGGLIYVILHFLGKVW